MIAAEAVLIAPLLPPGDAERGDEGAGKALVLVRMQQHVADAVKTSAVACDFFQRMRMAMHALPLVHEAPALLVEVDAEPLEQRRRRRLKARAEADSEGEFTRQRRLDLRHHR